MISLALQMLHFQRFLEYENIELCDDVKMYLKKFCTPSNVPQLQNSALIDILKKYEDYKMNTLEGKHGKTSQFYMTYVNLIDYFLMLNSSIRRGDFKFFKYVLPKLSNIFFVFNQPNYARYLVKYHDNLIKADESHPELRVQFQKGSFGIKRTKKPFSRQPIDLTLEQTINADAANKLTGISHTTNSISARQRWCRSHTLRSTIISHTIEQVGLRKHQDITADLQRSKIKKNHVQLCNFIDSLERGKNVPFKYWRRLQSILTVLLKWLHHWKINKKYLQGLKSLFAICMDTNRLSASMKQELHPSQNRIKFKMADSIYQKLKSMVQRYHHAEMNCIHIFYVHVSSLQFGHTHT